MSILIDAKTKVLCQGITGDAGRFHSLNAVEYGTQMVGGVTPGKGGQEVGGIPVFNTVRDAVDATGADATVIYVPAAFCADAICEAVDAGIELIVAITEGIPVLDMAWVRSYLAGSGSRLIGPNCPGIITPVDRRHWLQDRHHAGLHPQAGQGRHRVAQRHADLRSGLATRPTSGSASRRASASAAIRSTARTSSTVSSCSRPIPTPRASS